MMNKKLIALLAVSTISISMFGFLDDVVGGTFDAAERVATVPVDAVDAAHDGETWRERREDRREERESRREDRRARREDRRARRSDYREGFDPALDRYIEGYE